jgi:hypothetical protein
LFNSFTITIPEPPAAAGATVAGRLVEPPPPPPPPLFVVPACAETGATPDTDPLPPVPQGEATPAGKTLPGTFGA